MLRKGHPGSKQPCRTEVQTSNALQHSRKELSALTRRTGAPQQAFSSETVLRKRRPLPDQSPFPPSVTAYRLGKRKARQDNIYDAPFAVIVCACRSKAWTREDGMNTAAIDAAILTDRMMLEASSLGLGSVWICWSRPTY